MISRVTLLPSARRLIDSLREIGYDLPSALADIVDNSITAGASRVDITFAFDGADSWIRVADNGVGMSGSSLDEAMRYGTQRGYAPSELGRFGLGLKTASLSQCRRLTVASRRAPKRGRIEIRSWDLDQVARSNRWEVLRQDPAGAPPELVDPLSNHPGTVVMWEGLDRVLTYALPTGAAARTGFARQGHDVGAHLAMVFHRFLAGERGHRGRLVITMNGVPIPAWDPFARSEPQIKVLPRQLIPIPGVNPRTDLTIEPFILPSQERFSSSAAHLAASGPKRWNHQQGFYFYRNDRLIQAGGWNRLRTMDEHTKLARIAVDLPTGVDELFRVNVTKMRVHVPTELRDSLIAIASGAAGAAAKQYRRSSAGRSAPVREVGDHPHPKDVSTLISTLLPADRDLLNIVVSVVRDEFREEADIVRRLLSRLDRLRANDPSEPKAIEVAGKRQADPVGRQAR